MARLHPKDVRKKREVVASRGRSVSSGSHYFTEALKFDKPLFDQTPIRVEANPTAQESSNQSAQPVRGSVDNDNSPLQAPVASAATPASHSTVNAVQPLVAAVPVVDIQQLEPAIDNIYFPDVQSAATPVTLTSYTKTPILGRLLDSLFGKGTVKGIKNFSFSLLVPSKSVVAYSLIGLLFLSGSGVVLQTHSTNQKLRSQLDALAIASTNTVVEENGQTLGVESVGVEDAVTESPGQGIAAPSEEKPEIDYYAMHQVESDHIRYLKLPSIGISSIVGEVGLTADGAVDTPRSVFTSAWYNDGALPTEDTGAMFVVGHYSGITSPGVFKNLDQLSVGEIVTIERGDGVVQGFEIVEKQTYPVDDVDMLKAVTSADPERLGLNLMTCGGSFDLEDFQYDERTLIRAVEI